VCAGVRHTRRGEEHSVSAAAAGATAYVLCGVWGGVMRDMLCVICVLCYAFFVMRFMLCKLCAFVCAPSVRVPRVSGLPRCAAAGSGRRYVLRHGGGGGRGRHVAFLSPRGGATGWTYSP
jgi:hypothetical protein